MSEGRDRRQRHCWECLRRRLVCDATQPVCNRCRAGGIVCPGYDEKQPLRWIQPGQVTATKRRRKVKVGQTKGKGSEKEKGRGLGDVDVNVFEGEGEGEGESSIAASSTSASSNVENSEETDADADGESMVLVRRVRGDGYDGGSMGFEHEDEDGGGSGGGFESDASLWDVNMDMNRSGDKGKIKSKFGALSSFGLAPSQAKVLDTILRFEIKSENFAAMQASYRFNVEVYERCSPLKLLMEDSRVILPTVAAYSYLPVALKSLFILMTMAHSLHRLPRGTDKEVLIRARSAIAHWTCEVVHTLNQDIAAEKTRATDITMTCVMMLLLADQQMHPSTRWRFHYSGLMRMIQLRDGVRKMWETSPHMHVGIQSVLITEIMANSTSPSTDQLAELTSSPAIDFLQSVWGDKIPSVYIGSICPPSLLFEVVRINKLRSLAAKSGVLSSSHPSLSTSHQHHHYYPVYTGNGIFYDTGTASSNTDAYRDTTTQESFLSSSPSIFDEAQNTLSRILAFSPEAFFASATENRSEVEIARTRGYWLLMGRVHQSAVLLYCILSLQHVGLLPSPFSSSFPHHPDLSPYLESLLKEHYDRLLLDLKAGLRHGNFRNCLLWPLIVAGVHASRGGSPFERDFIAEQLADAVRVTGTALPLFAREVLRRFWERDRVYAIVNIPPCIRDELISSLSRITSVVIRRFLRPATVAGPYAEKNGHNPLKGAQVIRQTYTGFEGNETSP
ncbi:fungal-specific transcription factor domain-containing protein [Xylariaceae sp. FL0594]|nr:fungal-specific transcription factor domain-containing protein [Xylariaceae sp. FL0594]